MKANLSGVTRIVFQFDNFVIKIPKFTHSWSHFLLGLIHNMNENKIWKWQINPNNLDAKPELLCPIIYASFGGWFLVMEKAVVCEWEEELDYKKWIDAGFGGDDKPPNYGYFETRIVKIDYAL